MTQHRRLPLRSCLLLIAVFVLALGGCAKGDSTNAGSASGASSIKQQTYFIFDTIVTVKIYDELAGDAQFKDIEAILKEIDHKMNRQDKESEISKVQAASGKQAVAVSQDTFDIIATSLDYAKRTGGMFDPTVGPIVDLWGIGSEHAKVPDPAELKQNLELVDYRDVTLNPDKREVKLEKEGMELDLGSIGKGYAADRIADYLRKSGFESAIVDLGGNIFAVGPKPGGKDWIIGVQDPDETRGNQIGKMTVQNKTIVTSGVYERYFVENGKHYHHILNPMTGYPIENNLSSVTIVTSSSTHADALSTSTFALGLDEGMKFIESNPEAEAIFITTDHKVYCTPGIKDIFELTNSNYTIVKQ